MGVLECIPPTRRTDYSIMSSGEDEVMTEHLLIEIFIVLESGHCIFKACLYIDDIVNDYCFRIEKELEIIGSNHMKLLIFYHFLSYKIIK